MSSIKPLLFIFLIFISCSKNIDNIVLWEKIVQNNNNFNPNTIIVSEKIEKNKKIINSIYYLVWDMDKFIFKRGTINGFEIDSADENCHGQQQFPTFSGFRVIYIPHFDNLIFC